MNEKQYKGWEIIKLLEEGKLKDGTKISVSKKETKEKYVHGYVVYDNKIYYNNPSLTSDNVSSMVYTFGPVAIEQFASNNKFTIEKRIEYMTLQEAVATRKPLRLNEEWSKKLLKLDDINENKKGEEYKLQLLEIYQSGRYLYVQDMFIMLGWFLPGEDLRELISSNEKVWCVEE